MTDTSIPTRFAESDFRIGRVLNRTTVVFSRNILFFSIVTGVASLPLLLLTKGFGETSTPSTQVVILLVVGFILTLVLYMVSQAIVLYGAFQDMRGRPFSLSESLQVGLQRFLPIVGIALLMGFVLILGVVVMGLVMGGVMMLGTSGAGISGVLAGVLGVVLLIALGLILMTMWYVATPACVVER